jgi:hypothetical protein
MGKATVHVLEQMVELTSMLTQRQKPKTKKVCRMLFSQGANFIAKGKQAQSQVDASLRE